MPPRTMVGVAGGLFCNVFALGGLFKCLITTSLLFTGTKCCTDEHLESFLWLPVRLSRCTCLGAPDHDDWSIFSGSRQCCATSWRVFSQEVLRSTKGARPQSRDLIMALLMDKRMKEEMKVVMRSRKICGTPRLCREMSRRKR